MAKEHDSLLRLFVLSHAREPPNQYPHHAGTKRSRIFQALNDEVVSLPLFFSLSLSQSIHKLPTAPTPTCCGIGLPDDRTVLLELAASKRVLAVAASKEKGSEHEGKRRPHVAPQGRSFDL